jgi:UDP-3-O-acyl-N-acetylglucosamine deacetylase
MTTASTSAPATSPNTAPFQSLRAPISLSGPTLLSAAPVTLTIAPNANSGILFARADHPDLPPIPAHIDHLVKAHDIRTTSLILGTKNNKPILIYTIEHILSALAGLNIPSALVTLSGEAAPILDGSALPIVEALLPVLEVATTSIQPLIVTSRQIVRDDRDPTCMIEVLPRTAPGSSYRYEFHITRPGGLTITQNAHWEGGCDQSATRYTKNVAPARTFSFSGEAEFFRIRGIFTHFTPRDLLVIDDVAAAPIDNQLRFENELARHKLLDLIGDLALVGRPIQADIIARKAGHALNHAMARRLVALLHAATPQSESDSAPDAASATT